MEYVVTTDNSISSSSIVNALKTIKSVVKVFAIPASMPKVKSVAHPANNTTSDAKAMAFIESLSVKSVRKVPADERGIEARVEKY